MAATNEEGGRRRRRRASSAERVLVGDVNDDDGLVGNDQAFIATNRRGRIRLRIFIITISLSHVTNMKETTTDDDDDDDDGQ